ncbi:hypothetical protein [Hydrogenimonas sp.]
MKKTWMFVSLVTVTLFGIFFTGCTSGGYGSKNYIHHTYITDTQRGGHTLTGVEVRFKGNMNSSVLGAVGQALYMTKLDVTYFINREEIDTFNIATSGYSTFIKLPPGEHEFAYRVRAQGVMTLGLPSDKTFYVYRFTVPEGEISKIILHPTVKNSEDRALDIDFENVLRYRMAGKCFNDYYTCSPKLIN